MMRLKKLPLTEAFQNAPNPMRPFNLWLPSTLASSIYIAKPLFHERSMVCVTGLLEGRFQWSQTRDACGLEGSTCVFDMKHLGREKWDAFKEMRANFSFMK